MKGKVKNLNGNLLGDVSPPRRRGEIGEGIRVSGDLRRAADCSPGLWRIIKLAEESLRAARGGGQLGCLVILSISLRWNYAPLRDLSSNGVANFCLPSRPKETEKRRILPSAFFFFLPFPASFLFLPSFLLFLSNIVGTTLMPTECNRRKFSFPGKFSSQNDRAEQRFPHRLDINEGTLKSRRRKDVRTKQFR